MGKRIKSFKEENLPTKISIEEPEKKICVSLICLSEDGKEFKKDSNSLKAFVERIREIESLTIQQFINKGREKGGFVKEKRNQPNYNFFRQRTQKFKGYKIKEVEFYCYQNNNYGHCHVKGNGTNKLIRVFGILNDNKFCVVKIDWEGKINH